MRTGPEPLHGEADGTGGGAACAGGDGDPGELLTAVHGQPELTVTVSVAGVAAVESEAGWGHSVGAERGHGE
ncbi:MAG: hypothetical protein U0R19_11115 [Bryobacteraceae bacterium]